MPKPTICIDFDGVIHLYSKGWKDGVIYDVVTPGFFVWASAMKDKFELVIYSSRSKEPAMLANMQEYMRHQRYMWFHKQGGHLVLDPVQDHDFTFASQKPSAFMTIDDRCICFDGNWSAITAERIFNFKPWNKS